MFEEMQADDMKELLRQVESHFGSEQIAALIKNNPPNSIKRNIDWLHANCCVQNHPEHCRYYEEEEDKDRGWTLYQHSYWTQAYFTLLKKLNISGVYFTNLCSAVNILKKQIYENGTSFRLLYDFIILLMEENPKVMLIPVRTIPPAVEASSTVAASTDSALSPATLSDSQTTELPG